MPSRNDHYGRIHAGWRKLEPSKVLSDFSPAAAGTKFYRRVSGSMMGDRLALIEFWMPWAAATPESIKDWSLTSLKEELIKIGAKVVSCGCFVALQMTDVAMRRMLFPADSARGNF